MNNSESHKEFRLKSGSTIVNYFRQFSATEKGIFGTLILLMVITALLLAGRVNAHFMTEIPGNGGTLHEGLVGLPRTVNPVLAATDADRDISGLVYSGLMKYNNGNIVPDLAASSSISNDGLTYTFTLKPELHFQDGSPLSADDVVYTVQTIQDPTLKSPHRANWIDVTAKALSPTTVQFTLKQPYSPFIANTTIGIIPKHIWSQLSDDQFVLSRYNMQPIGSGPYKVASISRDADGIPNNYSLQTWNGYYGAKPHVSTITFSFFADQEKALSALDSGSIDSLASIAPADAARLASNAAEGYTILSAPLPRVFGVFFNQTQSPVLADKNVRMALDMTAPRDTIVKSALNGYGTAIHGPLPIGFGNQPATSSGITDSSITVSTSTIAKAQALLEDNGWKKDSSSGVYQMQKKGSKTATVLSFDIYTADTPDLKQAASILKDAWNKLGAEVDVKVFETSDLYQNVIRTRKYDALLFGESIGQDRDLYAFWHSSQRNAPGLNVALYTNSKVDTLLSSMRTSTGDGVSDASYAKLANLIQTDVPAVFLYVPDFIYAVPKNLHGIDLGSISSPTDRWDSVSDWYNTTEKVWKIFGNN